MYKCINVKKNKQQLRKDGSVVHGIVFFDGGKMCDSFEMNSFRCWSPMPSLQPYREIVRTPIDLIRCDILLKVSCQCWNDIDLARFDMAKN